MGVHSSEPINALERQPTIKIGGFSAAIQIPENAVDNYLARDYIGISFMHQGPENLERKMYKPKAQDYWSYGVSLYIYLMNYCPFVEWEEKIDKFDWEDLLGNMDQNEIDEWIDTHYTEKGFSQELISFQKRLFRKDPKEREELSFQIIQDHPWFSERVEEVFPDENGEN